MQSFFIKKEYFTRHLNKLKQNTLDVFQVPNTANSIGVPGIC